MDQWLGALTEAMERAEDLEGLRAVAARAFAAFDISFHTYAGVRLPRSGDAKSLLLTTYPDQWASTYVAQEYEVRDPVVAHGKSAILPYDWSGLRPTQTQREVMEEARLTGIVSGFSIPVHGAMGEFALVSLASPLPPDAFARQIAERRHLVHLAALYYHARVVEMTMLSDEPVPSLTGREREVLTWTAVGKTAWEIGQILRIAEPTVNFHVENAKKKLGARSRSLAVVKAILMGLIKP